MGQEYDLRITVKDSETREPLNSVNVIINPNEDRNDDDAEMYDKNQKIIL